MHHTRSIRCAVCWIAIVEPTAVIRHHVCAQCTRVVAKYTFLAVFLQTEIDDTLRLIIFKPREFSHFALLINNLNLLNHICRDILRSGLYVIAKEFLTIDAHTLNLLTIDGHITLFVHLYAIHLLEQFLYCGGFSHLVGSGVVFDGITLDGHLRCFALYANLC